MKLFCNGTNPHGACLSPWGLMEEAPWVNPVFLAFQRLSNRSPGVAIPGLIRALVIFFPSRNVHFQFIK